MKKLLAITLCIFFMSFPAQAEICSNSTEQIISQEHMFPEKKALNDKVIITNSRNIICKGNVFTAEFDCKFLSEDHKAGDKIQFSIPDAVYTQEGTLLIPACSKLFATIIKIQKPKIFNKNARVYLKFDCLLLPQNTRIAISAKPFTKDGSLTEGPWMTTGKLAASTIGLGVIGAGAGVGFSFIPNPAKIGTGLAAGIPVGCGIGLITGLITPGLKYHAKAGEDIRIILCENLCLPKN